MIRIERGSEPASLAAVRVKNLPALQQIVTGGRDPLSKEIAGYGPKEVRVSLWERQFHKCCYCEKDIEQTHEDVEHFRPKAEADRKPGSTQRHGYWWMAFTWENLLYSCPQCNEPPAKGVQFPIEIGSTPLIAENLPPGQERPLLINPADESGVPHIQFQAQRRCRRDVWVPVPRNNSPKGMWTIKVCHLDRDSLIVRYGDHVQSLVVPTVNEVRSALASKETRDIYRSVERAKRRLLGSQQRFVGLSYDAFLAFVDESELKSWGFDWPMPV